MDYQRDVRSIAALGAAKSALLQNSPGRLCVGGALAGAYVGVAIILIMTLGSVLPVEVRALAMGASFGLALILVVIAGADLFTGYVMYTTAAVARSQLGIAAALRINAWVFGANLAGAALLSIIYWLGQGPLTHADGVPFLQDIAVKKMHLPALALVARGLLCNWLVCLALWMSRRVDSDTARCIVIAWCLAAFIAAGFEHSVANMTVHMLALLGPANDAITVAGAARNLLWVSIGNIIGGSIFVAAAYVYQAGPEPSRNRLPRTSE